MVTGGYKGLPGVTEGYSGYRGLQGVTTDYRGVTRRYRELKEVTTGNNGLGRVTGCYKG